MGNSPSKAGVGSLSKEEATRWLLKICNGENRYDIADLIEKGANVNAQTKEAGITPLMFACEKGDIEKVRFLIEKSANVTLKNSKGETALVIAQKHNWEEIVQVLEQNSSSSVNVGNNRNTFFSSFSSSNSSFVGTDNINAQDHLGQTALMGACCSSQEDTVKDLIDKGANVNLSDENNETALHHTNDFNIAEILIKAGADVNATNQMGEIANILKEHPELLLLRPPSFDAEDLDQHGNVIGLGFG